MHAHLLLAAEGKENYNGTVLYRNLFITNNFRRKNVSYFEWSDAMSVHHAEIDSQHKRLIEMINSLHDAIVTRKSRDVHESIIKEMVQYTLTHFQTEEQYMQKINYPFLPNHKGEHEKFTVKALELQTRVENSGFILPLETLNFLRDWLKHHILGTDKKYSVFMQEHGRV